MSIGWGDLRKGLPIKIDEEPYVVVDYDRHKMQQRAPVMRLRLRSLLTGRVVDRSFQGYDVLLTPADVQRANSQFIYEDGGLYYFMDEQTYDQFPLSREQIADSLPYLKEETSVEVIYHDGNPIAIEMPLTVELEVVETDPGLRGDTAQGGTKRATLETGLTVQVPLFVEIGERVRVDTRTGEYLARA